MVYLGSKAKIANQLVPFIQSHFKKDTVGYLEPFVGGANVIDKIQHHNKIGSDIHKPLIALLDQAKTDCSVFPESILAEEYIKVSRQKDIYPDWYLGLVGYCATFGSRYFGGYARDKRAKRSISVEHINNLKRQAVMFKNITFRCCDFRYWTGIENYVIYCDPPYANTTQYTSKFPHYAFYMWVLEMSKKNTVLVSEYSMPFYFDCLLEIKTSTQFASNRVAWSDRVERVFTPNPKGYVLL